jgi:hypothetical protein
LKGGEGVDVGYWESLLSQLRAFMARARLRERHQEVLKKKLAQLKEEQGVEGEVPASVVAVAAATVPADMSLPPESTELTASTSKDSPEKQEPEAEEPPADVDVVLSMEDLEEAAYNDYEAGNYSPVRITDTEKLLELQAYVITEEDETRKRRMARDKLKGEF